MYHMYNVDLYCTKDSQDSGQVYLHCLQKKSGDRSLPQKQCSGGRPGVSHTQHQVDTWWHLTETMKTHDWNQEDTWRHLTEAE